MIGKNKSLDDYWDRWRCPRCGVILDRSETYCWNCKYGLKKSGGGSIIRFIDICAKVILIILVSWFVGFCILLLVPEPTDINTVNSGYTSDAYNNLDIQLETSGVTSGISIDSFDTALETEAALVESTVYEDVDLAKMLGEHKENPFRAEANYINRYVAITGYVIDFHKYNVETLYDHICLYDGTNNTYKYIYGCVTGSLKNELYNYNKGDLVTIKGRVLSVNDIGYQVVVDSLEKCE